MRLFTFKAGAGPALGVVVAVAATLPVSADPILFRQVLVDNTAPDVTSALRAEVNAGNQIRLANGQMRNSVVFTFSVLQNSVAPNMFIGGVFFDDGALMGIDSFSGTGVVDFERVNGNGALPQGTNLNPDFEPSRGFTARFDGGAANGVQAGESLSIRFALLEGMDFNSVLASLNQGLNLNPNVDADLQPLNLRIGVHIQGLPGQAGSDSYVNTTGTGGGGGGNAVPLPGVVWGGIALLGGAMMRRRRLARAV